MGILTRRNKDTQAARPPVRATGTQLDRPTAPLPSYVDDDPDGEKPLSRGSYDAVTVMPRFDARTLARMDALGPEAWGARRGRHADKQIRREQKAALRRLEDTRTARRKAEKQRRRKAAPAASGEGLPVHRSLMTRLGLGSGFAGTDRLRVPWHSTSVARAGILTPWLAAGGASLTGPTIGIDWLTGGPFRFDAWAPYRAHITTSSNILIVGMMGSGKSMCLKTLADREIAWGRNIIIEGDPKGEWAGVARSAGGSVVRVGDGEYLNPLDVGSAGEHAGDLDDTGESVADSMRTDALKALAAAIRPARPLDMAEQAVISAAVRRLREDPGDTPDGQPTITGLVTLLTGDWPARATIRGLNPGQAKAAADSLVLIYNTLVEGPLRGAFEKTSSVSIRADSPIIVFDTGSAGGQGTQRKAVFTASMAAAIDSLCQAHDGRFRIVIAEEGWDVLRNPVLVDGWDRRMRLSGDLGVSNIMLMHELSDLEQADADSGERTKIEGILTKSATTIIYQQSAASLGELRRLIPDLTDDEADTVSRLPQGVGLWRVGGTLRQLVYPIVSPGEYAVFNTDAGRNG
ncbi:ATP-binding protein [Pseudoscardovia radai]|uniref:ATP-binding protein n=1 Tax=Pseudoscardovia radai TaxID=987066 RepID=UPI0039916CB7